LRQPTAPTSQNGCGGRNTTHHKVAASEFAIDGKIEKSEVARSVLEL
jgi:hypothetical protein